MAILCASKVGSQDRLAELYNENRETTSTLIDILSSQSNCEGHGRQVAM
jgi:hypothetical protein